jgi:hypothetical protein
MVYFRTKNLDKFFSVLQWKMLVKFMDISTVLLPFCICHGHLDYFVVILVYFSRFGMLYQEKYSNPINNISKLIQLSLFVEPRSILLCIPHGVQDPEK